MSSTLASTIALRSIIALLGIIAACWVAASDAFAQEADGGGTPDPSLVQLGRELATLVESGNFEEVLQRWEREPVTCPSEFSTQLCEGIAEGQVAEGYPVGVFGSQLPVQPRDQALQSLENLRLEFAGSDVRLFSVGVKGSDGSNCADCILVLSTPADSNPAGASVRVIAFWVSGQGSDLLVQYAIGGRISPVGDLPLLQGGDWRAYTMVPVEQVATPQGVYPHGTRIGIAVVDQILDAVENDRSLVDYLQFVERECHEQPQGRGLRCPDGVEEGTVLESVFSGTCQAPGIPSSNEAGLQRAFGDIDSNYYLFGVGRRTNSGPGTPPGGHYTVYLVTGPGPAADAFVDRHVRLYVGESGIFGRSACDPLGIALSEEPEIILAPPDTGAAPTPPQPPEAGMGTRDSEGGRLARSSVVVVAMLIALLGGFAVVAGRRS